MQNRQLTVQQQRMLLDELERRQLQEMQYPRNYPVPYDPRFPSPMYSSQLHEIQPYVQRPTREPSKAGLAGITVTWFLASWLLVLLHPAITLFMWFFGIGYLLYRAVR